MRVLFIGDIFGEPGIKVVEKHLPRLIKQHRLDFVIAQGENVSDRKGLVLADYTRLKQAGVNAFTMGNHVWAKPEIFKFIDKVPDIVTPLNVPTLHGVGSRVFEIRGQTIRVTALLGVTFMQLFPPWTQTVPNSFFDAIDKVLQSGQRTDHHIVDFHAETTSEKNVLGLYLDGKVSAVLGTHTHVQTADARVLPKGTAFVSDVGMTGPSNCAIGAAYKPVYNKMRYNSKQFFTVGETTPQFNAVLLSLTKNGNKITCLQF